MKIFLPAHKWLLAVMLQVSLVTFSSCEEDNEPQHTDDRISWNVVSTDMQSSRAMIEDVTDLKDACSYGNGKSIGIKSSYILNDTTYHNVLGNPDSDVSLIYDLNTTNDNYEWWTYNGTAAYWQRGAKYTFNAYYPMEQVLQMSEITSNANSPFVIGCNTELFQDDLLMAYKYVNTSDSKFNSKKPVELNMLHALSALKFDFKFSYGTTDALTEFWIENTENNKGLFTIGELEFGSYNTNGSIDNGESIKWNRLNYIEPTSSIYHWKDATGIAFSDATKAPAYSTNYDGLQKYTDNSNYIFIIPQENDGTTYICFKLKSTGEKVYRVKLPIPNQGALDHSYNPGSRYNHTIIIGKPDITINLTIADWNEIHSSVDIPL